ncbi:hypothetical protein [Paraburkholderia humisilvae]|uniref:Uncharacterized protein n=1 Tax=Paraburkholderia humisilvae TaxID=627669 RepID=A0A6J5DR95_9BURK|nr:hypothetical protein [Paraburkholderia humisilvae]CAB3756413.1 hypothetical protein LMG29542_02859 [Paraburkholderia humisilvae]
MIFYHHGAAIQPSAVRHGNVFLARACILEEDGEATSLGDLGAFANRISAFEFAISYATAFVDGDPLPRSPFEGVNDG